MSKKRPSSEQPSTSKRRRQDEPDSEMEVSETSSSHTEEDESVRSGKILRMRLINFMCHSNLVVDFNRRVNLIIGNNGSGKSAVLTALVVGLGSNASKTNRSANMKQLIKTGESKAIIEIEIANDCQGAYEFETYGRKITIIRSIGTSSSYKIKNEQGQVVSTTREELRKIMLYHNIQTDNPVFVLNQDAARSFLKDLDESKNYQLFLKATQIEFILEKLNKCGHMYVSQKYHLDCCSKQSELMKKEVKELHEKYELLQSVEEIKMKMSQYSLAKLWKKVSNQEKVINEIKENISKIVIDNEKLKRNFNNKTVLENEYKEKIQSLEGELLEKEQSLRNENHLLTELRNEYNHANEKYQNELRYCKKLNEKIRHYEEQVEILKNNIEERSESCSSRVNKLRQENEAKMEILQKQNEDLEAMMASSKRDIDLLTGTRTEYEDNFQEFKRKRQQVMEHTNRIQADINRIQSSSKDSLSVYGNHVKPFLLTLEKLYKSGKLSELPRGPIGKYIQVPDKKWRGLVEQLIGGLLNAFIVNNSNDRTVVDGILRKEYPGTKHPIITNRFHKKVYDVRSGTVRECPGASLFMKQIRCSDAVVMNCLIDRVSIETILFVEDQDLAVHLTSEQENVPQNLQKVVLREPAIEYYPAPMYRAYSINIKQPRFLQVNMEERQKQLEHEINELAQKKQEYEMLLTDLREKLGDAYRHQKETQDILDKHEGTITNNRHKLEELQQIEYPNEGDAKILVNELIECQKKLDELIEQLNEKKEKCQEFQLAAKQKDVEARKQDNKIREIESDLTRIRTECDNQKIEFSSLQNNARHWKKNLDKLEENLGTLKETYSIEAEKLESFMNEAEREGERVETEHSVEEIEDIIKRFQRKVEQIRSTAGEIDVIKAVLGEKEKKLKKNEMLVETITETLDLLKKSRIRRFKTLCNLRNHMALRVQFTFESILKLRGFVGEIVIKHDTQKLQLSVIPRDNHISTAVSNTKSLSGGERSYSTIAFLISLWSCVDHPFYFLDEYDVFTDQVNREIMTLLLLNEADKKPHRQYSFLSPQDMSFVKPSETVQIHRLHDPKR